MNKRWLLEPDTIILNDIVWPSQRIGKLSKIHQLDPS